jgi:hypothetical protein
LDEAIRVMRTEAEELGELIVDLAESTRAELNTRLEHIRRAPIHLRPTLALTIPLVLARERLPAAKLGRILECIKAMIETFPDHPDPLRRARHEADARAGAGKSDP